MGSSNYRFSLDIQSNVSQVSLPVRLGDTYRTLYITLNDGGVPYTIEDGCVAIISAKKPDGKYLANACTIKRNSVIKVKFTEQTANVKGIVECEVRLYAPAGEMLTSARFIIVVSPRAVGDGDVSLSENEKTILDAIGAAEAERKGAELARADAETVRTEAESARVEAEQKRAEADEARQEQIVNLQSQIDEIQTVQAEQISVNQSLSAKDDEIALELDEFRMSQSMLNASNTQALASIKSQINDCNSKDTELQEQIDELKENGGGANYDDQIANLQSQIDEITGNTDTEYSEGLLVFEESNWYDEKKCVYVGRGECADTVIKVPPIYEGKRITAVNMSGFEGSTATEIMIPNTVYFVEENAFDDCPNLTTITFGSGTKWIGGSYYGCYAMKTVICLAEEPPHIEYESLFTEDTELEAIYVLRSSVDKYKSADGWSYDADKIQPLDIDRAPPVDSLETLRADVDALQSSPRYEVTNPSISKNGAINIKSLKFVVKQDEETLWLICNTNIRTQSGFPSTYQCTMWSWSLPENLSSRLPAFYKNSLDEEVIGVCPAVVKCNSTEYVNCTALISRDPSGANMFKLWLSNIEFFTTNQDYSIHFQMPLHLYD